MKDYSMEYYLVLKDGKRSKTLEIETDKGLLEVLHYLYVKTKYIEVRLAGDTLAFGIDRTKEELK